MIGFSIMLFQCLSLRSYLIIIFSLMNIKIRCEFIFTSFILLSWWAQVALIVHCIINLRSHFLLNSSGMLGVEGMLLDTVIMEDWVVSRGGIHLGHVFVLFIFFAVVSGVGLNKEYRLDFKIHLHLLEWMRMVCAFFSKLFFIFN